MTPDRDSNDEREVANLERRLSESRPVPSPVFRGELRRRLLRHPDGPRPRRVGLLITAYAGSGMLLLTVAALGLAEIGPLAP